MESSRRATEKKDSKMKAQSGAFNPFKSKKIIQSSSKSSLMDEAQASDPSTPQKSIQLPSRSRNRDVALSVKEVRKIAEGLRESKKKEPSNDQLDPISSTTTPSKKEKQIPVKLPEKYELLIEFFHSMEVSIRLLNLKGTMTNFTNISSRVESLTDRRFSYAHLAQLKYILPEAIILKKILLQDEQTLCMKPDLQITLQKDAFQTQKARSGFASLRKVFRSRLVDFSKANPEGDDVPEETLPEPFNRKEQEVFPSRPCILPLPIFSPSSTLPQKNSALATHLAPSFQRRFSQKTPIPGSQKTSLLSTLKPPVPLLNVCCSNVEKSCSVAPSPLKSYSNVETPLVSILRPPKPIFDLSCSSEKTPCSVVPSPIKRSSKLPIIENTSSMGASPIKIPPSSPLTTCIETNHKTIEDYSPTDIDAIKETPVKLISTPARLMTSTPDLQTPKRSRMYLDDDSAASPSKLARRPPRNRSLFNTPMKNVKAKDEMNEEEGSSVDLDILKLLPETLVQSIRDNEKRIREEQDSDISRAKLRKKMIASLPKMFDMIHLIFQSINRSVVTKEELIHKLITNHCDIVDRREVEEQLKLLQEFIPEWIWEKVAFSGDILLCINKISSAEFLRRRLAEIE